jgi:hypothetical protein
MFTNGSTTTSAPTPVISARTPIAVAALIAAAGASKSLVDQAAARAAITEVTATDSPSPRHPEHPASPGSAL